MLFSYSIENFKPFKLNEKINLLARPYKKHKDHLINEMILPVISIYGPNGGGKTSLLESIFFLKRIVLSGNLFFQQMNIFSNILNIQNKNENNCVKWEIEFLDINFIYKYVLKIDFKKLSIEEEKFSKREIDKKEKIIFHRKEGEELILCSQLKNKKIRFNDVIGSYLHFISSVLEFQDVNILIREFNKITFLDGTEPQYFQYPGYQISKLDFDFIDKNKQKYLIAMKELDINIKDFIIKKQPDGTIYFSVMKEDLYGNMLENSFQLESKGTKKIFDILTYIFKGLHNNLIFVVDELDSSLHTKLLRYIISIFLKNKNKNSAQLIFNSHDIGTLDNKLFRKDEIYFAGINESYFSNVVCLADFDKQIRESNSFAKLYLDGKLGYDPYIDCSLEWFSAKQKK